MIMNHKLWTLYTWQDIFKIGASVAASEFCEWVQVRIDVYIPHQKYQVKPHSSACAAALSCLSQQNKFKSKVRFRQTNNHCKSILEAAKLAYANKTESITF